MAANVFVQKFKKYSFFFVFLLISAIIHFGNTFKNEFSFDDHYVQKPLESIVSSDDLAGIFTKSYDFNDYRPVSTFTFALEKLYFGELIPEKSHLINLFIYIVSVFLLCVFVYYLTNNLFFSLSVSLLFLTLPLHSSMIASLKNRDGLLSCLFGLSGLIFLSLFFRNKKFYTLFISTIFFGLAIISKLDAIGFWMIAVFIPFIFFKPDFNYLKIDAVKLFNRDFYWFQFLICLLILPFKVDAGEFYFLIGLIIISFFVINKYLSANLALFISLVFLVKPIPFYFSLPFFGIFFYLYHNKKFTWLNSIFNTMIIPAILMWGIVYLRMFKLTSFVQLDYVEHPVNFTENPIIGNDAFLNKLSQSIQTYFEYLKFMVMPDGFYFYFGYDMLPLKPLFDGEIIIKFCVLLLFAIAAFLLGRYNKIAWLGGFWFFSTLAYASNIFVPVAGIIADRYAYIASAGFCMVAIVGVYYLCSKIASSEFFKNKLEQRFNVIFQRKPKTPQKAKGKNRKSIPETSVAPVFIDWAGVMTLAFVILVSFVCIPFNRTRVSEWKDLFTLLEADLPHLEKSFEAHRIASSNYIEYALSENVDPNDAQKYLELGEKEAQKALDIYDDDAYVNESLMLAKFRLGKTDEAVQQAFKIVKKYDYSSISRSMLTDYYFSQKNYDSAAFYFKELIKILPQEESLYYKYTNTLRLAGKSEEAIQYAESLRSNRKLSPFLVDECIFYIYFYNNDMGKAAPYFEAAYDKGLRNQNIMFSILNYYVETNNKIKVETLRKKWGFDKSS